MVMIHILLIDDDLHIRTMIQEYAQAENWVFSTAENGMKALEMLRNVPYDLIILDVMMPGLDGWATLKQIRRDYQTPVIMLTARDEEYDRLLGFELGADDYLGKPFSPKELIARIKARLKRADHQSPRSDQIAHGNLTIQLSGHQVTLNGRSLALTPKEYDLLVCLSANAGQVFTREQLLGRVWGDDYEGDIRTVDTHIRSLRDKLGESRIRIETVWGTGYRFAKDKLL